MVKGWGGHKEGTRFESQWGQRMKKKLTYQKKKKTERQMYHIAYSSEVLQNVNVIELL